ncbi:hypothetical protein TraAM80_09732, partial [Trypanosoma rangeli]
MHPQFGRVAGAQGNRAAGGSTGNPSRISDFRSFDGAMRCPMNSSPGQLLNASELLSPPNRQIGSYRIDGVGECCIYFLALPVFKGMLAPWLAFLCVSPSPSFLSLSAPCW